MIFFLMLNICSGSCLQSPHCPSLLSRQREEIFSVRCCIFFSLFFLLSLSSYGQIIQHDSTSPLVDFHPRLRGFQLDFLKPLLEGGGWLTIDLDLVRFSEVIDVGYRTAFFIQSYEDRDIPEDQQRQVDGMIYASYLLTHAAEEESMLRYSLFGGISSVRLYKTTDEREERPIWDGIDTTLHAKFGAEAQLRFFNDDYFSIFSIDYFWIPQRQSVMKEYVPFGLRMGYSHWF